MKRYPRLLISPAAPGRGPAWLVIVLLVATLTPAGAAKTVDFDALTIADINKAFDSGALTAERLVKPVSRVSRPTIGRGHRCTR